jgi:hypothetical protein
MFLGFWLVNLYNISTSNFLKIYIFSQIFFLYFERKKTPKFQGKHAFGQI